jgi:hypothetical protein
MSPQALSPELNQRLIQQFPPGSQGPELFRSLMAQGFKQRPPCDTDLTIHVAMYEGPISGFLFKIYGVVYWKTDNDNAIVWTKAIVSYDGL